MSETFSQEGIEDFGGYVGSDDSDIESYLSDEGIRGLTEELFEEERIFRWEELKKYFLKTSPNRIKGSEKLFKFGKSSSRIQWKFLTEHVM